MQFRCNNVRSVFSFNEKGNLNRIYLYKLCATISIYVLKTANNHKKYVFSPCLFIYKYSNKYLLDKPIRNL